MTTLEERRFLQSLRVVVCGDVVPRLPPRFVGGEHGVRARVLLNPYDAIAQASYSKDDGDDALLWATGLGDTHIYHALFLGGETTPSDSRTISLSCPWPVVIETEAEQGEHQEKEAFELTPVLLSGGMQLAPRHLSRSISAPVPLEGQAQAAALAERQLAPSLVEKSRSFASAPQRG